MRILLVDDNIDCRISIAQFLKQMGHQLSECGDGETAWEILGKEQFHLVLSDIKMPGMNGHELLLKIKESPALKETEVVLITGYGSVKDSVTVMNAGAYDYLLKPIQIEELVAVIDRIAENNGF